MFPLTPLRERKEIVLGNDIRSLSEVEMTFTEIASENDRRSLSEVEMTFTEVASGNDIRSLSEVERSGLSRLIIILIYIEQE